MGYTIASNGQVTLPKPVREWLGVSPGGEVAFRLKEAGEVAIEKASGAHATAGRSSRWRGFFGSGPSTDEILAMTRGEVYELDPLR
ncbi:MAG: AbrB/MazE/SpoVT family DNA-binding domain-containing protein [Rhodospirillales bacterium]